MSRHVEPLNGGVWSALDPALLKPGQLSAGRNFVYLGGSPAIYRSWGRGVFGSASAFGGGASACNINGLRDAQFDGGDHILIALASASYLTATVGDTGTFGVLASGLPGVGSQLDAVQYRNRFYLLPGIPVTSENTINSNSCVYVSATGTGVPATLRQHGMLPVNTKPVVTTAAGTFSQTVTGKYWDYWTTEVAKITADTGQLVLESTFMPPAFVGQWVSAVGVVPIVERPSLRNALTTHWRIYRSPAKDLATDPGFPTGYMIGEFATAITTAADTAVTSSTGLITPANANGVGGDGATYHATWANASAAFVSGANFASATAGPLLTTVSPATQGYYGFDFGGFGGSIKGVEVKFAAYLSSGTGNTPVMVWIAPNRQSNGQSRLDLSINALQTLGHPYRMASKSVLVSATNSASLQTVVAGTSTDRWFPETYAQPLNSSDFNGNFMVVLGLSSPNKSLGVDYVRVTVHHNATFDSVVQFPNVVYTYGDEVIQVGKNGPPPSSSTGDLFQDSLVVNDLSDPSKMYYSFPGEPESFPSVYYLNFETRENDAITLIKVVNNRLVVGLNGSLWRVNYLPSERDATFDRGKATECITKSYGVVNPMCACTFMPDGASELLAFVSNQGIHYTDGYNFTTLTDGVDWRTDCLSTSSTSTPIALINDKENCILRFYYQNDALGNESYMCLPLCYGAGHWVNGQAKVGGMMHMRGYYASGAGGATATYAPLKSAWTLDRSNGAVDFLFGYGVQSNASATASQFATGAGGGQVYRETGTTIPSLDSVMQYTTRRMYLAGLSKEWRLNEVYGYAGSYTGGPVVTYTAKNTKTNSTGEATVGAKSITLTGQQLHRVNFQQMCEGLRLNGSVVASSYRQENLVLDGENFGLEDSGR